MKLSFKNIALLHKTAIKNWWVREPFKQSAVVAYYAIFSLPGLIVVIMTIAGYFMGAEVANKYLYAQISVTMGHGTADAIQNMVTKASESKNTIVAGILGIITILIGATAVFVQFQKSLNVIWDVKVSKTKSGFWSLARARLFSYGLIITIAFILMVSFVVTTFLIAMGDWLSSKFSDNLLTVMQVVNFTLPRLIIAMLFALMFKYLPDAKIKWKYVWLGSIFTALMFLLGVQGMSLYFGKADPEGGYGAAGTFILILIWLSFSSLLVFYGAEFTRAYAEFYGGYVPPEEHAVKEPAK